MYIASRFEKFYLMHAIASSVTKLIKNSINVVKRLLLSK